MCLIGHFHNKGYYVIDRINVKVKILIVDRMRSTIFIVKVGLKWIYFRYVTFYLNL